MENMSDEERWALFVDSSVEMNGGGGGGEEEEAAGDGDEDEALSLCDLPLTRHESRKQNGSEDVTHLRYIETDDDFDFCSLVSTQSEMCAADEVFYQGQILPLRRSIKFRDFNPSRSVDGSSSGGLISSRSSSIGSHHSSSSSSSSGGEPKQPPRNQFQYSHPSPSPRTHFSGNRREMPKSINAKKSSAWNIFRLGLVAAPPEISFHDLKTRRPSTILLGEKKIIKNRDFLSGCRLCSADAVDTVPSKVVIIKRSASDGEREAPEIQFPAPKKRSSQRRTAEWLKQLKRGAAAEEH